MLRSVLRRRSSARQAEAKVRRSDPVPTKKVTVFTWEGEMAFRAQETPDHLRQRRDSDPLKEYKARDIRKPPQRLGRRLAFTMPVEIYTARSGPIRTEDVCAQYIDHGYRLINQADDVYTFARGGN
jgi:hypothetical protein